jgi:hypothetical protein
VQQVAGGVNREGQVNFGFVLMPSRLLLPQSRRLCYNKLPIRLYRYLKTPGRLPRWDEKVNSQKTGNADHPPQNESLFFCAA